MIPIGTPRTLGGSHSELQWVQLLVPQVVPLLSPELQGHLADGMGHIPHGVSSGVSHLLRRWIIPIGSTLSYTWVNYTCKRWIFYTLEICFVFFQPDFFLRGGVSDLPYTYLGPKRR